MYVCMYARISIMRNAMYRLCFIVNEFRVCSDVTNEPKFWFGSSVI